MARPIGGVILDVPGKDPMPITAQEAKELVDASIIVRCDQCTDENPDAPAAYHMTTKFAEASEKREGAHTAASK